MGMTMTQKILAAHAGLSSVQAGQLIECDLDIVMGNDVTTPVAIREFEKAEIQKVFDKNKVVIVPDHFTPNKDIQSATHAKMVREFAHKHDIVHYYEVGRMGIEHCLLPEKGIVTAGDVVVGADSHTCTYGALGAFSTGVGSTDMACGMAIGKLWFKVPSALRFVLKGKMPKHVSGKDLILHIIGMIGVDGALYKSMEFTGEGVAQLSMDDRFTICNMAIEAGGKNGIFPVDAKTLEYIGEHSYKPYTVYEADEDAEYEATYEIDLSSLRPVVAFPHLPENAHYVDEIDKIKIDQVVIGSCTNGRISDLRIAAEILKGRQDRALGTLYSPAGYAGDLSSGGPGRPGRDLCGSRSGVLDSDLRAMSRRPYGNSGRGRKGGIDNKSEFCRTDGTCGFRGLSGKSGCGRGFRDHGIYHGSCGT